VDDWTVIAALAAGTTSFTDNAMGADDSCKYAVVHKDLAYNYSTASVIEKKVEPEETGIVTMESPAFHCFGGRGFIITNDLKPGKTVSIYAITGVKVFEQESINSMMTIPLEAGIYIVNVSGEFAKVMVR
jgi:hypothetical protein